MSLESDLFEKLRADENRLLSFGFARAGDEYVFKAPLCGNTMHAVITVKPGGRPYGRVYDEFDGEYVAFRPDGTRGTFASKVRGEYISLLEKIAAECFDQVPFSSDQANRIADYILREYRDTPEYIFAKFPEYAVFRHAGGKWYALMAPVAENQIEGLAAKTVILNVKAKESRIAALLSKKGIYPAFHMSRGHWVTVSLDDSLADEEIFDLIAESRVLTGGSKLNTIRSEWIVPANPKYFDLDHAFAMSDLLYWKQSSNVKKGDLVYIYYGAPYSELRYLCEAVETDIPFDGVNDGPINMETLMRLRKIQFFDGGLLNRKMLAGFGVTNIRGPRYMPAELKKEINRLYHLEENKNE
ncbi:MAG: MmcQ/YjbR family DNA-binding protein [Erysipelotrichaceae bacterium]|nr:MmcQ/YjbR family DNA-binding protein [Erysipelotrichaceae bacterium]